MPAARSPSPFRRARIRRGGGRRRAGDRRPAGHDPDAIGVNARSWLGWQMPIETSAVHGAARIEGGAGLRNGAPAMARGEVAVVAGFQGVAPGNRISTLGRGGSDTARWRWPPASRPTAATSIPTSMASTPPIRASCPRRGGWRRSLSRRCWRWRRWAPRCCRPARSRSPCCTGCRCGCCRLSRPIWAAHCFATRKTSWKRNRSPASPIAATRPRSPCTGFPDQPGVAAAIFGPLADAGVNVDMIVQNVSEDGKKTDLTFTVARSELRRALAAIETHAKDHRLSRHHL